MLQLLATVAALAWLTCTAGCLKEPAADPVAFDLPTDPIVTHRPSGTQRRSVTPRPDPFIESIPADELPGTVHRGFTGAIVYGNPQTCPPCRLLCEDLAWLRDQHGWTLSVRRRTGDFDPADWVLTLPDEQHDITPAIEYYEHGVCIAEHRGYSGSASDPGRRDELRAVVSKHPRARRDR